MKNKSSAVKLSKYIKENYTLDNNNTHKKRLIQEKGTNDADYVTYPTINGNRVKCPAYRAWDSMITRVYSTKYHNIRPTYINVDICDEWLTFSNFRKWFIEKHVDGYELDKDILSPFNYKIYSPTTCVYIPQWLNQFILTRQSKRGKYKIGVCWDKHKNKYLAVCGNPKTKKKKHCGRFDTELEAYESWLNNKLKIALELKPEMDEVDLRIYPNIIKIIKNMT